MTVPHAVEGASCADRARQADEAATACSAPASSSPGATRVAGTHRALDARVDLVEEWEAGDGFLLERCGDGLASAGVADQVALAAGPEQLGQAAAAAAGLLEGIEGPARDQVVVLAALAFDGAVAGRMVVPSRLVRRHGARASELVIRPCDGAYGGDTWRAPHAGAPVPEVAAARNGADPVPPAVRTRDEGTADQYRAAVAEATRRIAAGELTKVVLARTLHVDGTGPQDARAIARALRRADPGCYTFAAPGSLPGSVLLGASPELLLRRRGATVHTTPLGGSAPRSTDPAGDREAARTLLASAKDRREHALVVDAVAAALGPFCESLDVPSEPELAATAGVWHLGTAIRGILREPAPSALALAAILHPTPAVCGSPRSAALAAIHELEPVGRGLYSGITGWVDAEGDGEWVVSLRCAELSESGARLYAGAGIVAGSVPEVEIAETEAKFGALLAAIRASAAE